MEPSRTIEWSPIIAGTILACATSLLLIPFGQALGLSFTDLAARESITWQTLLVFGLWTLWVQITASVTGAYLAGRMLTSWGHTHESELRDGAHGLLVWALSSLVTVLVLGVFAALGAAAMHHGIIANPQSETDISDELARKIAIISGFSLFAIALVSAAVAWFVATIAGDHRDRKVNVNQRVTFRRVAVKR